MIWIVWAMGCLNGVENQTEFTSEYALAQCYAYKQCYRMLFDGKYDGMEDCESKVQKNFQAEQQELYEGCTFKAEQAQECIDTINQSSCGELWDNTDDIYTACHDDVWSCP